MEDTTWQKLSLTEPTIKSLLWLRPERTSQQARLAVIGGSNVNFTRTQQLFSELQSENIQTLRVYLPAYLQNKLPPVEGIEFVGEKKHTTLISKAWSELSQVMNEFDALFICNDISNNSETTLGAQKFLASSSKPIVLDEKLTSIILPEKPVHTIFCSLRDIQELTKRFSLIQTITSQSSFADVRAVLDLLFKKVSCNVIFRFQDYSFVRMHNSGMWFKGHIEPSKYFTLVGENFLPIEKTVALTAVLSN